MVVVAVGEAHDDADVDVEEERTLPRREVARDRVVGPLEEGAEAARKLVADGMVVDGRPAAADLALGQRAVGETRGHPNHNHHNGHKTSTIQHHNAGDVVTTSRNAEKLHNHNHTSTKP